MTSSYALLVSASQVVRKRNRKREVTTEPSMREYSGERFPRLIITDDEDVEHAFDPVLAKPNYT